MKTRFPLSFKSMIRSLFDVWMRFPVSVVAIAVYAVFLCWQLHCDWPACFRLPTFLSGTVLLSVAAALAVEDRIKNRAVRVATTMGVPAVWGAYCLLFLPKNLGDVEQAVGIEVGAILGGAWCAIFFVTFLGRGKDGAFWNFTARTLSRVVLGAVFSGILMGGLSLAVYAVDTLFGADLPEEIFGDLAVLCFVVFAPLYVLAGVPAGEEKHNGDMQIIPTLKVLGLYILSPILALYTVILYVYLLKIVVTWELPNGWVSWLVSTLGFGGLAVTALLYPVGMRGENRVVNFLSRWMGVIFLPLLALMTIGIARRVSDYGWTVNRCYILLTNLWFYAIYIYLFVVRGRRVKWILISAVAVALISSVGPWSVARNVTPREDAEQAGSGEESYQFFSSDNTIDHNVSYPLDSDRYDKYVRISWSRNRAHSENGSVTFSEKDGALTVTIPGDNRRFAIPFEQASREKIR